MAIYTHYTDHELTVLLNQNDHGAFNEIYNRYWQKMLLIAWNHCDDKVVAKDIVQEVFLNLWEKYQSLDIQNLPAFLATAVKFKVFKYYRLEQRRQELAKQHYKFEDLVLDEEKLDAKFLQDFIDGIVEEMPEKCRLIFKYSRTEGLRNIEIADKINITEKGVENTLTRALKIIRGEMKNHGISLVFILHTFFSLKK